MKRSIAYAALFLAAFSVGLIAQLPAALVLGPVAQALESQGVRLAARGVNGNIWQGGAEALAVNGLRLDRVEWRTGALGLLGGRLAVQLRGGLPGGAFEGALQVGHSGSGTAERLEASFAADTLTRYLKTPIPVVPAGTINLNLTDIAWEGDLVTALKGRLVWRQAALTAPQKLGFGDLVIDFSPRDGGGISGKLSDGGGPLLLSGDFTFERSGVYRIDARVAARPGAPAELSQALLLLGKPGADGRARLSYSGRL